MTPLAKYLGGTPRIDAPDWVLPRAKVRPTIDSLYEKSIVD